MGLPIKNISIKKVQDEILTFNRSLQDMISSAAKGLQPFLTQQKITEIITTKTAEQALL